MIYGLIIAAGKQSRFGMQTPKALMSYKGSTLLDINIKNMNSVCDRVFVVVSTENCEWFDKYNKLIIESGKGCGDAVMQALKMLDLTDDDTVFIQWGDCLHKSYIYNLVKTHHVDKILVPCVKEDHPYVQIIPQKDSKLHVSFSKYNEQITPGYHDISLFYGNATNLRKYLQLFAELITSHLTETTYQHKHNNEMQFLDVFNETDIKGQIVEIDNYNLFSFNTLDEFNNLVDS